MPVKVQCPNPACAKSFNVDESLVGRSGRCNACGNKFTLQPAAIKRSGGANPAPAMAAGEPAQVGRFQVRARLGSGAFGTVYRAYDPQLDREIALKVPRPGTLDSPKRVERFLREARAAAQLRHPNIVAVYDAGQDGGRHYIAAAFVAGRPLSALPEENGLDCRRAAQVVRALAEAAAYAHSLGIVHRDIKPANVILDDQDRPHLMDFGLAARADEAEKLTQDGSVLGTPAYMAPEQAAGQQGEAQPAGDLYSLGILLYELLTGRTPFEGPAQVVLYHAMNTDPPAPHSLRADVPTDLETICLKAMAKKPEDRYADCQALADDLGRWLDDEFIKARPISQRERFQKWRRRHPRLAAAVMATAVLLLLASGGAGIYAVKARADAADARQEARTEADRAQKAEAASGEQAEAARRETEEANARTSAAKLRGDQVRYARLIADAQKDHRDNNITHARSRLDATRWDLRGWEHDYLRRLTTGGRLTLRGHDGPVTCVVYSGDGKRIVSGGTDRTVRFWDALTGEPQRIVKGLDGEVRCVAFSPDGQRVAVVVGRENAEPPLAPPQAGVPMPAPGEPPVRPETPRSQVKVFDAQTGQEVITIKDHPADVWAVAFSPDGTHLAGACGPRFVGFAMAPLSKPLASGEKPAAPDKPAAPPPLPGVVKVWDAVGGKEVLSIPAHASAVFALAYSPDGKQLATGSNDMTVKVFDAKTGKEAKQFIGHSGPVHAVAFSLDSMRVASASADQTVKVWQLRTNPAFPAAQEPVTFKEHKVPVLGVAFNDEAGRQLVSVGGDLFDTSAAGEVKVWNSFGGSEEFALKGHTRAVRGVAFRPDGDAIVTASDDGTIKIWDAKPQPEALALRNHWGTVHSVAVSPDGQRVASAADDTTVRIWDAKSGKELLALQGHAGPVLAVAFSPDGKKIVTGTGRPARGFGMPMPLPVIKVDNDEEPIPPAELPRAAPEVRVWDARAGKLLLKLSGHTGDVHCVAFSPDGKRIASGADAADRDEPLPRDPVRMVEKGSGGEIKLWDAETGKEQRAIKAYKATVTGLAFSPDGSHLAAGSTDQSVRVWNPDTGEELLTLEGPFGEVYGIAYSPDGQQVAGAVGNSCLPDKPGEVVLWDAQTGKAVNVLRGHERQVRSISFSGDGKRLVSGGGCGGGAGGGYGGAGGGGGYGIPGGHGAYGGYGMYGCYGGTSGGLGEIKVWDPRTGLELLNLTGGSTSMEKEVTETISVTEYKTEKRLVTVMVDGKPVMKEETVMVPFPVTKSVKKKVMAQAASCIASVAFSPDNQRIVCGDAGGGVHVFEGHLCQPHHNLRMYAGVLRCVAYSPDGQRIATGGESGDTCNPCQPGEVKVWDARTGEEVLSLRGHSGYVYGLVFSPDGKRLAVATGCVDQQKKPLPGEVKVWNLAGGKEPLTLKGHAGFVTGVAWNTDGTRLVSGSTDRTAKVWDSESGVEVLTIKGHAADVNAVAFSPDGKRIACAVGDRINRDVAGEVKLWDALSGEPIRTLKGLPGAAWCVAFTADGKGIAAGSGSWDDKKGEYTRGEVKVWSPENGEEIRTIKGHAAEINGIVFDHEGKWLATAGGDWTVRLWEADSGDEMLVLKDHAGAATAVACSPDGTRVASAGADSFVKVWEVVRAREAISHCKRPAPALRPMTIRPEFSPQRVAFSPDGKRLAVGGVRQGRFQDPGQGKPEDMGWVGVWDTATRQQIFVVRGHADGIEEIVWAPDGKVLASAGQEGAVKVWDAAAGKERQSLKHGAAVMGLAFGPDGKRLLSAGRDGSIKFWDVQTGKEEKSLPRPGAGNVTRAAFSPDGLRVASGHPDGTIRVWDLESGKEVFARRAHPSFVYAIAMSPDGTRVISSSGAFDFETQRWVFGQLKVWDAAAGNPVQSLKGHAGLVKTQAFSADGTRLASVGGQGPGDDETVILWDGKTGRPLAQLRSGLNNSDSIALNPDGSRLALAAGWQGVKMWDVTTLPPAPPEKDGGPVEAQKPEDRAAAEWILKKGGIVQIRVEGAYLDINNLDLLPQEPFRVTRIDTVGKNDMDDATLENLKGLTDLKAVIMYDSKVTGAGLVHLKASTKLEEVNFDRAPFTDAGLEQLQGFTDLAAIGLRGTKITDAGLARLAALPKVRLLALSHTGITDAGFEPLKGWTRLTSLWLDGMKVSGTGLAHLKGARGLTGLFLQGCPITDEGMAQIAGFAQVAELYFEGRAEVTDGGLVPLAKLTKLQQLRLAGKITDAGLVHLKGLTHLHNLWLDNLPITDGGLEQLQGLKLGILGLSNTRVTDAGLVHLEPLKGLESVGLAGTKVTDAGVEKLRKALPRINVSR